MADSPVQAPELHIDLRRYELTFRGEPVRLEKLPFDLLVLLAEHHGELVSRDQIQQRLWGNDVFVETDKNINVAVRKIRRALGDDPDEPRLVQTLVGRGYRLIAPVRLIAKEGPKEGASNGSAAASVAGNSPRSTVLSGKRLWFAVIAVTVTLLTAIGIWRQQSARARAVQTSRAIAVLPLKNLSADPDQEYFAEGITDELTTELARVGSLRVISHTSARNAAAKKTVGEIGRELNVDTVVEGTVLRSGDRVRVTVQLIDTPSDRHLWAESYERDLHDVLTMQDEIAAAIAREIRVRLTPTERLRLSTPQPINPAAHDAYLRGVYEWNRWDQGARNAVECFTEAIRLDSGYSAAYAGLSNAYSHFGIMGMLPPGEAWPKARTAALKALELNDQSAEAHAALGYVKHANLDWAGAEGEYLRAIELNPNYATAHHWYGLLLAEESRFDEGIRETQRAEDLDPLSTIISASLGRRLYLARRYDQAIAQFQKTLQMNPNFGLALSGLGAAYIQVRKYPEAIAVLEKAGTVASDNPEGLPFLGLAYSVSGNHARAKTILEQLQDQSKSHYVSPYFTAIVRVGMGETNHAVRDLQQAARDGSNWIILIGTEPVFDSLRSDPGFVDLVRSVGPPSLHPVGK